MISHSLMRRLKRIEARPEPNLTPCFRVEFYRVNESGTLIHLDGGDPETNGFPFFRRRTCPGTQTLSRIASKGSPVASTVASTPVKRCHRQTAAPIEAGSISIPYPNQPYVIGPPWSSLVAYDLNSGTIKWKVPLGQDAKAAEEGATNPGVFMAEHHRIITTSTGLLFVATTDGKVRAHDTDTGKVLWTGDLCQRAPKVCRPCTRCTDVDSWWYRLLQASTPGEGMVARVAHRQPWVEPKVTWRSHCRTMLRNEAVVFKLSGKPRLIHLCTPKNSALLLSSFLL